MKYLSALKTKNLRGKTAIVRVDFNIENKRETFRLETALPTIEFLLARGVRVVLISHRGRPLKHGLTLTGRGLTQKTYSLKMVLPFLKKNLSRKITFLNDFNFSHIKKAIDQSPAGAIFLLENIRLFDGEEENSPELGKDLAVLGDFYVNDAFSVSHRTHASITQIPKFLPSFAGLRLEEEIENLGKVMRLPKKPLIVILGGAKVSDKIGIIENLSEKADAFLIGGAMANAFLKAKGMNIGASVFEENALSAAEKLLKNKKLILPFDFISHDKKILDIGPLTAKLFTEKIIGASTIIWNGPMGLFENPRFAAGSNEIAKAIAKRRAFSVAGGGETTYLIHELGLEKKFDFLSTGGGSMLEYLAGKKLPGVMALENNSN